MSYDLQVVAFIFFVIGTLPIPSPVNLTNLGLACYMASLIFGH